MDGRLPYSFIVTGQKQKQLEEKCENTKIKHAYECWNVPLANNQ